MPLSVVCPVRLSTNYWGDLPRCQSLFKTDSPTYMPTHVAQSIDLESIADTDCPGRLILKMPQTSPSDVGHKELTPLFHPHSPDQFCTPPSTFKTN